VNTRPPLRPNYKPPEGGERLAKLVAKLQSCSRSEAEQYIDNGYVLVNGRVVTEPGFRVRGETVTLAAGANLDPIPEVTFVLNLSANFRSGDPHPIHEKSHGPLDPSPIRWHPKHLKDLETFAPLERGAGGLIVLTQDWRIARKLQEDERVLEHEFSVEVASPVEDAALEFLNKRIDLSRWGLSLLKVSVGSSNEKTTRLRFALKGYQLGVVAALCEEVRWKLLGIKRLRLGRVALAGLPEGQWRYLQDFERF